MSKMSYQLRIPDSVAELVRNTHPHVRKKIRSALKIILTDPHEGKALKDELKGIRSFRVSRFRIIYRISRKNEIEIIAIGPRERIYEETLRILKSE